MNLVLNRNNEPICKWSFLRSASISRQRCHIATQSASTLPTRMTPNVVQQFCHPAFDLVSISLSLLCNNSAALSALTITILMWHHQYAAMLPLCFCAPMMPTTHWEIWSTTYPCQPNYYYGAGGGEITPVHPFNHPSLLISTSYNPADRSALKLTWKLWNPHAPWVHLYWNLCVLYFFCSLICASFVSRFVFIPSCIRNKLYT